MFSLSDQRLPEHPMRVSGDPQDPGFAAHTNIVALGWRARVFLNGIERKGVVTADERQRFIVIDTGRLVGSKIELITLYGDVVVVLEERACRTL